MDLVVQEHLVASAGLVEERLAEGHQVAFVVEELLVAFAADLEVSAVGEHLVALDPAVVVVVDPVVVLQVGVALAEVVVAYLVEVLPASSGPVEELLVSPDLAEVLLVLVDPVVVALVAVLVEVRLVSSVEVHLAFGVDLVGERLV